MAISDVLETSDPTALSASAVVRSNVSKLMGIFVSTASGTPTITVYNEPTALAGVLMVNTFIPLPGTYYPLPFTANRGIYVVITGTVTCTVGSVVTI